VRVDIARLDDLMDLTGEIVTARTRLDDLAAHFRARDAKDPLTQSLAVAIKEIGAQIDLLQEAVTTLRMVPVRQLFSKFPRTVRDLAHRSGKQIRLVTEGERTELDKRLIEQVEDSMLHMVRNACDHGIEDPPVREAAGKPATGTVTLSARAEGNHVMIEVRDDGAGLDLAAIWQKAVDGGLVSPDAEMDKTAVAELIMRSGFSTAREVTNLSGRGVGMDVVRQRTAELGGTITIMSEPGQGTTITVRLPMTLAILPSLLVQESGRTFAVPIAAVAEALRVPGKAIRRLRGMHVMDLRGETIPVARLSTTLGLPEVKRARDQRVFVIVVATGEQRLGVMVDALAGQQSVVVKNLESAVGRAAGISGATILGDGSVVPIVDVDGLAALIVGSKMTKEGSGGVRT
jgi:two-component system chemotaxis sensor kinase CheA